ncbi:hypothetical protein GGI22_003542, partial [Coemansia erecta]
MSDADDLQYDSVVSDPGVYDGILGNAASARDGTGAEDSNNMLTPSTHRAETPPPPPTPVPGVPSDSIPSLLEFDHERHDSSNLNGSQQSQYGMKSGMYTNGSKADFMTQLKGDVVVSGRWSTIGEPQVPRSALRGNRSHSQQANDRGIGSSPGPLSPQTVSFAGLGPLTNSDASLPELKDEGSTMASGNSTAQESIVFRPQEPDTHRYESVGEDDDDGMSTQPLEDDNEDPEVEDTYQQDQDGSDYNQGSGKTRLSSAVSIGVGMAGGIFAGALPLLSHGRKGKQTELEDGSAGSRQEERATADIDRTPRSTAGKNESAMETHASSLSTTSSLSSVQTEPMHSHLFSNLTTPISATREGASASGSPYTTPLRRPTSSRKTPNMSSRNVNPLARHLAMKAIRSVPSAQRGATNGALSSSGLTPTHTGRNGVALPLAGDHQSMHADISEYDAGNNSAIHNLDELQKQFDIFADQLKHDASTAQADIVESERAWNDLQYELHQVKTQLLDAETTRDFYQRQAEESEKNRLEWEQERQHLVDENNDLQNNIELWHQRIGDIENERQGIWKEGM